MNVSEIIGKTFVSVEMKDRSEIVFTTDSGVRYIMSHDQDCCESVSVEDIEGDLNDLVGSPILQAEESTNREEPKPEYADSFTWTFYKFATIKGYVTIRWLGESNGYYSESVDFFEEGKSRYSWD